MAGDVGNAGYHRPTALKTKRAMCCPDICIYPASLSFYMSCSMAGARRSLFCGHDMDGRQAASSSVCSGAVSGLREKSLLVGT